MSGEVAQIQCLVKTGDLPLNIHWSFSGKDVAHHMGVTTMKLGKRTSILTVEEVTAGHSGTYTCTAQNDAGSAKQSAELVALGTYFILFHLVLLIIRYTLIVLKFSS